MNTNNTLTPIVAPTLSDVKYAENLNQVFDNINDNFEKLAVHDFIKGEPGTSITIVEEPVFVLDDNDQIIYDGDQPRLTVIGEQLKDYLRNLWEKDTKFGENIYNADHTQVIATIWDNFNVSTNTIKIIYTTKLENGNVVLDTPISSLYYTFFDGRFVNKKIDYIAQTPELATQLVDQKDYSCIVVFNNSNGVFTFDVLTNSFPTVYYDEEIGLCWKIHGLESGIPVQGVKGKDGKNAILHVVKCESVTNDGNSSIHKGVISDIYVVNDGFIPVSDDSIDIDDYDKASVLVLTPISDNTNGNGFYFGQAYIDENSILCAECNTETAITNGIEVEHIISALKNIKLNGTTLDTMHGLFLPIKDEYESNGKTVQPVHLLTSTAFTNAEGQNISNTDVIFTPINDINHLEINESNPLLLDKYLYVVADKSRIKLYPTICDDLDSGDINTHFTPYNYVLKYKLSDVVVSALSSYFDSETRHYGMVHDVNNSQIQLDENNTVFISKTISEAGELITQLSSNHFDSMPDTFKDRLSNGSGIYRWELCKTKDNFDVIELSSATGDGYDFSDIFSVIYTTDASPSLSSDIMWFDGITPIGEINDEATNNGWINNGDANVSDYKYLLHGWNTIDDETYGSAMFDFVKLIPVYNNAFATDDNSTLNLNYNVNITGISNSTVASDVRTLNVHGNIGCDTLSVDGTIDAREIKNIYTSANIIGDTGIKLGKIDGEHNEYNFTVDTDGVVGATDINCVSLNTYDINVTEKIATKDIIGNTLKITGESESEFLNVNGDDNRIDLTDTQYMTIKRPVDYDNISDDELYVLKNDLPVLNNNNSNIIVTEQNNAANLCMHGVKFNDIYKTQPDTNSSPSIGNIAIQKPQFKPSISINKNYLITDGTTASRQSASTNNVQSENTDSQVKIDAENTKNFNIGLLNNTEIKQSEQLERLPVYIYNDAGSASKLTGVSGSTIPIDLQKVKYIKLVGDTDTNMCTVGGDGEKDDSKKELSVTKSDPITLCTFSVDKNDIENVGNDGEKGTNNSFDNSNNIKITFNEPFVGVIGIYAKMSYGAWPVMLSESKFKFDVVYCEEHDNKTSKYVLTNGTNISYELPFDTTRTVDKPENENGKYSDGTEWIGYSNDGIKYTGNNTDYTWRNYEYAFKPMNITFDNTTMVKDYKNLENDEKTTLYNVITNAYEKGIEFKFELRLTNVNVAFSSQKTFGSRKSIIKAIRVSNPAPVDIVARDTMKYENGTSTGERTNREFKNPNNSTNVAYIDNSCITVYFGETHFNTKFENDDTSFTWSDPWMYPVMNYENYIGNTKEEADYIATEDAKIAGMTDGAEKNAAQENLNAIINLLAVTQRTAINNACKLTYNYLTPLNDFNTHTICNDGSIIMTNNDVFGLGYVFNNVNTESTGSDSVKIPALFYYDRRTDGLEDSTSISKPTIDDYIERTHVIPLKELFDMIEFYNANKTKLQTLVSQ